MPPDFLGLPNMPAVDKTVLRLVAKTGQWACPMAECMYGDGGGPLVAKSEAGLMSHLIAKHAGDEHLAMRLTRLAVREFHISQVKEKKDVPS
jgi:hypothetical protein